MYWIYQVKPNINISSNCRIVMNLELYDFILAAKDTKLVTARWVSLINSMFHPQ